MNNPVEKKILVWGKTYPELSTKYFETVCTGGVLENGQPVRLYPIPFRYLQDDSQFSKYQWISANIYRNPSDPRPESFKIERGSLVCGEKIPTTKDEWGKRALILFQDPSWIFESVEALLESQEKSQTSLGVVEPKEITRIYLTKRDEESARTFEDRYDLVKRELQAKKAQPLLFEDDFRHDLDLRKHTYVERRVKIDWKCFGPTCKGHSMQILDWEVVELQRRLGDQAALDKVTEVCNLNTHAIKFFLGNLRMHPKSFLIVGLWYPKLRKGDWLF